MSVRFGLLALLEAGPSHGYQLKADFEARTGGVWTVNVGQVYSTLQRLERDGLITREVHAEIPPRVVYDLTPAGRTLGPILRDLQDWAREHMSQVLTSQAEYDQR